MTDTNLTPVTVLLDDEELAFARRLFKGYRLNSLFAGDRLFCKLWDATPAESAPPHTLEVGDVVLRWASGNSTSGPHVVTAIGSTAALVSRYGTQSDTKEYRCALDGALVRTKEGREVIAHWPEATS